MTDGLDDALRRANARVGRVLKQKWTLDGLLGVGGMAAVYLGTHRNKRRGAVKMLHLELSADPTMRQRFLREGYLANSVGHRGAVEVYDDDVAEDGSAFLVMELLEGETLEARRERKGGELPALEVLALMDQLLDTLAAAHEKDIVHRDLKPENLFLQRGGVVKVLDFGIARLREAGNTPTATQSGNAMGTPAFMAPEQARGRWEDVDGRTDLWAVGASMFTLLTGEFVHGGGTVNEILARAITHPTPPIRTVKPSLDPQVAAFVDRALAYDKDQRFSDARDMQTALRALYHELVGGAAMRVVQSSLHDDDDVTLLATKGLLDDTGNARVYDDPPKKERSALSQNQTVRASSAATLTTGRGVTSTRGPNYRKSSPSKWISRSLAGVAVGVIALVLYARSGSGSGSSVEPVASAVTPSGLAPTPHAAAPTVLPEAPAPTVKPIAVAVASSPTPSKRPQPSAPRSASTISHFGERAAPLFRAAPAPAPPKQAPAELFRKRQ